MNLFLSNKKLTLKMGIVRVIKHLSKEEALLFRFEVLRRISRLLVPSYRFKWPYMEWWNDIIFNEYLDKFNEKKGLNTDRRWMLYQIMRLTENIPGDTAECGVYKGAGSYIICKLNQENKSFRRVHYLFDSFEGLSTPLKKDGKYWSKGDLSCPLDVLKDNLSKFNKISIHKGWIPQCFSGVESSSFCFVHIDVDLYAPTLDSLNFFYSRMSRGGVILCDDYGCTTCPGATEAVDSFLEDKEEKMLSLSGGGGFLIKGTKTSRGLG
ncbi:TylF/MycF/NovP-related O-methyltransferase [Candidatus Electronema sp. TJ]|uniref:TylF/MycF/NovP-related O-methyltransferase n=1 Tax=Candidatus Electronema sp. TJ TaxID=3401573 RepID=UPI003AA865CC